MVGARATVSAGDGTAIGVGTLVNQGATSANAFGANAIIGDNSTNSTALGTSASVSKNCDNSTAIGFSATAGADDVIVLGRTGTSGPNVGISTAAPTAHFHIADRNTSAPDDQTVIIDDLALTDWKQVLVYDNPSGQVQRSKLFTQSNCSTANFFPVFNTVTGANGNPNIQFDCSIMQQNLKLDCTGGGSHNVIGIGYTAGNVPGTALDALGNCVNIGFAVNTYGALVTNIYYPSDRRIKENILPISNGLDAVRKLNPTSYSYVVNNPFELKLNSGKQFGFIADEVEKIIPEAVVRTDRGYSAINYNSFIPILTSALQEQQTIIEIKNQEIQEVKSKLKELEAKIETCFNAIDRNFSETLNEDVTTSSRLFQNSPNPFSMATVIGYYVPEKFENSVMIRVYSIDGTLISEFVNLAKGYSKIEIPSNSLKPGSYIYTLAVSNTEVDSKIMIVTK